METHRCTAQGFEKPSLGGLVMVDAKPIRMQRFLRTTYLSEHTLGGKCLLQEVNAYVKICIYINLHQLILHLFCIFVLWMSLSLFRDVYLQSGVQKPTEQWVLHLLHHLCPRLLRIMLEQNNSQQNWLHSYNKHLALLSSSHTPVFNTCSIILSPLFHYHLALSSCPHSFTIVLQYHLAV